MVEKKFCIILLLLFVFVILSLIYLNKNFSKKKIIESYYNNYYTNYNLNIIKPDTDNIYLFWEGNISDERLELLLLNIASINYFNKNKKLYLLSNSLNNDERLFKIKNICKIVQYNFESLIKDTFLEKKPKIKIYDLSKKDPRQFCDFLRFVILYKYGGTYTDTDNLCFRKITNLKNVITRTYDEHYAHHDKILDKLIPGKYKYNKLYENIPFTLRNDNWINIKPKNNYLKLILNSEELFKNDKPLYIYHSKSWQWHIQNIAYDNIDIVSKENLFGLNLVYFFDDFVSYTCKRDLCLKNNFDGEMCELYKNLPNIRDVKWGTYKTNYKTSISMLNKIKKQFPTCSFIWLATKEKELIDDNVIGKNISFDKKSKKKIKSWIYLYIKKKINFL